MQKYQDVVVNQQNQLVSGASVAVYLKGTTTPATIYSDNGVTTQVNPMTTSNSPPGAFSFYAADGRYDLSISGAGISPTVTKSDVLLEDPADGSSALAASSGSSLVGFIRSATGAVSQLLQALLRRSLFITPEEFGAVGDGATDDQAALTAFINALNANPRVPGLMGAVIYAVSGSLPDITASGVRIYGAGSAPSHEVGQRVGYGSVIRRITNSGGTLLQVAPIEGAGNQRLDGVVVDGVVFDCNSLAAKGFVAKSVRYCYFNVDAQEGTTCAIELGVVTTLGENTSLQGCTGRLMARQVTNAAPGLILSGSASGNPSLNQFSLVDILHKDAIAMQVENADSNNWGTIRAFCSAGGAAVNSIEWRGGATAGVSARSEWVGVLTATKAPIAKGTGTYTVGAQNIQIGALNKENGTPDPTVETGASLYWENSSTPHYDGTWSQTTPTAASSGGTMTNQTCVVRVQHVVGGYNVRISVSSSNIGTGSGSITVPLPFTAAATGSSMAHRLAGANNSTGVNCSALISGGGTSASISAGGSFPLASGQGLVVQGFVEA